jgi:hypothetical protein
MEHRIRINLFSTAAVISLGVVLSIITSTVVASRTVLRRGEQKIQQTKQLTVKGYARMPVVSNLGVWHIDISSEGPNLADTFTVLDAHAQRVQAFLDEAGFAADEITVSAVDTATHYVRDEKGHATREIESHTLQRRFTVTTNDVHTIGGAAGEITSLLKDGVPIRSHTPQYTFTNVGDLKIEILGLASADARQRAEEIADKSGCTVAEVRGVRMGVMQITRPHSTDVSGMGIYDTSTIDKDISVVVTVTYALAQE